MRSLDLRMDGSEVVRYNTPDFPLRAARASLAIFAGYAAECHWHRDFEALIPLDGEMDYRVNGQRVHLRAGDAILVNGRRLHYGYSEEKRDCNYCFCVFPAELLGPAPAVAGMLKELCGDGSPDYWLLRRDDPADAYCLAQIRFLCEHDDPRDALALQAACASLLDQICRRTQAIDPARGGEWQVLRGMIGYIQTHYPERIFLADVAAAGAVCRSRCCRLFRDKLGVTPGNYITRYRLEKACALLREGATVTEAALACGFQGLSFFSETFRRQYGMTPTAYLRLSGIKVRRGP